MQTALHDTEKVQTALPHTTKRILLFFILLAALSLRLYHINQPYTDLAGWRESSMAMMADNFYHRNPNILYPEVSWNGPGESYNGREFQTVTYTSNLLYRVLGQHDWVGRLVAVLFGVWGVFALYQLVRRVWDEKRALAGAAMLALLPAGIYFDRSFLPDPAMVSLVTTSLWMLLAYLQSGRMRYLILTMAVACLGFLTKITGMITLLPMLYAVLTILHAHKKRTVPELAKLVVPGLVVVGIVAAYYLWARHLSLQYPPYHFAGADNWLWDEGITEWIKQRFFLNDLGYIFENWTMGWPFILLFLTGVIASFFYIINKKRQKENTSRHAPFFFHFWLLGCMVFYGIGAKELIGNFWNFHIWSPVIAAFCGSGVLFIWERFSNRKVVIATSGLLLFAWIAVSNRRVLRNTFTDNYYKTDYRMGMRLRELRQPGDLVVVLAREVGSPIAIFYSGGRGWVFPPAGKVAWDKLPPSDAACIATLDELRKKGAAWFAIYRQQYDVIKNSYPQFAQYIVTHFQLRAEEADYIIFQLQPDKK